MIALVSIAFIIYSVYMISALARLQDFPISLSASHYAWNSKWQFPFMMISVALLLLPVWIELTPEQWPNSMKILKIVHIKKNLKK